MSTNTANSIRRPLVIELISATAALLVVARLLFMARGSAVFGPYISVIVAVVFLYTPIFILWVKKRPIDFLDREIREYLRSFIVFAAAFIIVFPPFLLAAHGWEILVLGKRGFAIAGYPNFATMVLAQLLLVALPEEFFFRGYFQSAMNRIFPARWSVLGARLGIGWIITAAVFALSHSVVYYQWWHFSIFFPALLFGYLRERTGSITAAVLFHAASNIIMDWVSRCYL